ncbi:MAG: hypothetical protein ACRELV_01090 [Longimicrobiales bacterium]
MRGIRILLGAALVAALFPLQASAQAAGSTQSSVRLRGAPIDDGGWSLLDILLGTTGRDGSVWDRRDRDDDDWDEIFDDRRGRNDRDWEHQRRRQIECRQRIERARLQLRHEHERWHLNHNRDRDYRRKHAEHHFKLERKARKDLGRCDDVARGILGGRIDIDGRSGTTWPRPPGGADGGDRDEGWERRRGGGN